MLRRNVWANENVCVQLMTPAYILPLCFSRNQRVKKKERSRPLCMMYLCAQGRSLHYFWFILFFMYLCLCVCVFPGANGLANPRDFEAPVAHFEDPDTAPKYTVIQVRLQHYWTCIFLALKFLRVVLLKGGFCACPSAWDVVGSSLVDSR